MNVREQVEVKKRKIMIPLPFLLSCELLVSVKENTDMKWKKRRRKKERIKIRIEHKTNSMLLILGII